MCVCRSVWLYEVRKGREGRRRRRRRRTRKESSGKERHRSCQGGGLVAKSGHNSVIPPSASWMTEFLLLFLLLQTMSGYHRWSYGSNSRHYGRWNGGLWSGSSSGWHPRTATNNDKKNDLEQKILLDMERHEDVCRCSGTGATNDSS